MSYLLVGVWANGRTVLCCILLEETTSISTVGARSKAVATCRPVGSVFLLFACYPAVLENAFKIVKETPGFVNRHSIRFAMSNTDNDPALLRVK